MKSEFFNTYEQKETESQETIGQHKIQYEHQDLFFREMPFCIYNDKHAELIIARSLSTPLD